MLGSEFQHYRILRQLGAGGMGVVYEAEDTRLGRHVALKVLPEHLGVDADAVDRFEREARIASSLNHPNICTIYDIGVHEHQRFIVMELLEGESLRSRIAGQPLPIDQVVELGCQLADALEAAHAKGIIHRDIKPANVFITKRGQAKLLDFGIAKLGGESHEPAAGDETRVADDVLTQPGMAIGSINYMSPEQARGESLDGRTDLFALGLVLYEMATGKQAFAGQTTAVVFDAILNRQPAEPRQMNPDVPEELQRVILRALEKDRRLRFQTAADMLAELQRIRRDSTARTIAAAPATTGHAGQVTTPVTHDVRSPSRWLSIGVPALIVAGVLGYFGWNATRTPAFTERDTLVVADFVNTTGDAVFDDALKQAVSVQLQQTPYVTLLADNRVLRTLQLMQRDPTDPVTGPVAREVCQRAGAKATVEGSIQALGSSYVMALGVHNCETGESIAQQQAQADSKEDVLRQLGSAVTALRQGLGESLASIAQYDVPVTEATTPSLDALKAYGAALRTRTTRGDRESIPLFQEAIARDPDFALAHAKLSVVMSNLAMTEEAKTHSQRSYDLRERVSEYERLYIEWNHAARVLRDLDAQGRVLEVLVSLYPRDFSARNNIGVYYSARGELEKAAEQYRVAAELAPGEPLPASNLAFVLYDLGRHDEGHEWASRSLAIRPNGNVALRRWSTALLEGDPRAAEFEGAAVEMATPIEFLQARAQMAMWQGRLGEFLRLQQEAETVARNESMETALASIQFQTNLTTLIYQQGQGESIDAFAEHLKTESNGGLQAQGVAILSMLGLRLEVAREMLPALEKAVETGRAPAEPVQVAAILLRPGGDQQASAEQALLEFLRQSPRSFDLYYYVGRLRESRGDVVAAIAAYRRVVDNWRMIGTGPVVPDSRLKLGQLLAAQGDTAGAREQFETLLEQWADSTDEFAMKAAVQEGLAALR
jgi:tetratricopeptide (TPR) repeat protein